MKDEAAGNRTERSLENCGALTRDWWRGSYGCTEARPLFAGCMISSEKLWREIAGKKVFPLEPAQMRDMDGSVTQSLGDRAAGFHQRGDVSKDELRGILK